MRTVSLIVFPGGFNLPLWAGQMQGFFSRYDLDLRLNFTSNSVEQLTGLIKGQWDLGLTAFDNVVAYQEGQGEATIEGQPDLFAFMGGDSAFLRLVVQNDIASYNDLKSRALSVDALTTGFAFVLRKMLALNGLKESEVQFERAGGVMQRWEALKAGKHAGTLLLTPFELLAEKAGLRTLQSASAIIPSYQGLVGTTRRAWAAENSDTLQKFIRGYLDSLRWLYEPANKADACALLLEKIPGFNTDLAARTYDVLLAPGTGFEPRARLDTEGMKTVLNLRSEYATPQKTLSDTNKYLDLKYYERADAQGPF